jgi:hypothetical protein
MPRRVVALGRKIRGEDHVSARQALAQVGNSGERLPVVEIYLDPRARTVKAIALARDRSDDGHTGVAKVFEEHSTGHDRAAALKRGSSGVTERTRLGSCRELFPLLAAASHRLPPPNVQNTRRAVGRSFRCR